MNFDLYGCQLKILEKDEGHIFCQVPCADGETGRMDMAAVSGNCYEL